MYYIKPIPHTQEELHELFYIDGRNIRWKISTHLRVKAGDIAGSIKGGKQGGHRRVGISGKSYFVHRVVWKMVHGSIDDTLVVDHIDGDRLNNSPYNLQQITDRENRLRSKQWRETFGAIFFKRMTCEHCGTETNKGNYHKHHGDNCRSNHDFL